MSPNRCHCRQHSWPLRWVHRMVEQHKDNQPLYKTAWHSKCKNHTLLKEQWLLFKEPNGHILLYKDPHFTSNSTSSRHFGCWMLMVSSKRENLKRFSALSIISGEVPRMCTLKGLPCIHTVTNGDHYLEYLLSFKRHCNIIGQLSTHTEYNSLGIFLLIYIHDNLWSNITLGHKQLLRLLVTSKDISSKYSRSHSS